jgi:magnesium transporter
VPILQLKKDLFLLRRAIWPHREMVAALSRDDFKLISATTRFYFRDCYDHTVHLLDLTETFREMVSDLRDLYMNVISNRVNETMRALTLIATIFNPLTFIVGLYGMNFDPDVSPWNMPELRWYYGYPFAFGLMAVTLVISVGFYVWRGWLSIDRQFFSLQRPQHGDDDEAVDV